MFIHKKSILFITKSKIKITSVSLGARPKEDVIAESDWDSNTLPAILAKYKKAIGNSARLLISEDFVYVIVLSLPSDAVLNKDIVGEKAQGFIPEDLKQTVWDFNKVGKKVQVVATVKELYENLSRVIAQSGLRIETIDPLSFSLARFTQREVDPILFIFLYDKAYLTLAQKETVLATELLDLPISLQKVKKFILFTKEGYGTSPKKIIFCGNTKDLNLKEYEKENITVQELSPTISLAYKEDAKDKNKKVLNLELIRTFSPSPSSNMASPEKNKFPNLWIISIFFFIIVIIAEVFLYFNFTP